MKHTLLLLFLSSVTYSQVVFQTPNLPSSDDIQSTIDSLPKHNEATNTNEHEVIILDGDTVLRSKLTQEIIYTKPSDFKKPPAYTAATFSMDHMNYAWHTSRFNPYSSDDDVTWPLQLSFSQEKFTMPIDKKVVTSRYGWRRGRAHRGIDFDLVTGDNVRAIMDGKVRFAKYYSGFGNVVVIRHNNGLESVYAHLSKILVSPNTHVKSGHVIAKGGNTGRSTGSHLHLELRYKNQAINPEYLIDFENEVFRSESMIVEERWADPRRHRSYKQSNIQVRSQSFYKEPIEQTFQTNQPIQPSPSDTQDDFVVSSSNNFEKEGKDSSFQKQINYHVIERGDTLGKIAKQYSTSVSELCKLNKISKSSVLKIGQQIRVN